MVKMLWKYYGHDFYFLIKMSNDKYTILIYHINIIYYYKFDKNIWLVIHLFDYMFFYAFNDRKIIVYRKMSCPQHFNNNFTINFRW